MAKAARDARVRARVRVAAVPTLVALVGAYIVLAAIYAWQASRHLTPTIFTDELEFAQISRAIADTGLPGRRGETYTFTSLYPYLTAPAWWLHDTETAYELIKTLGVLVMTAVVFPAYGLARMVVSRPWALFAAIGAAAAPALSYAPFLVEEPLAYPVSTLALWLISRALVSPTRGSIGLAALACAAGFLARTQLAVLFAVLAISLLVPAWRSARFRRYRAGWTAWDRVGAAVLAVGFVLGAFAFLGHESQSWYIATSYYKGRMFDYGLWAFGALAVGLGLLPFVAGLAGLVRPRRELEEARTRAFVTMAATAILAFGFYAAVKAAYLSTVFSTLVIERNLIYLVPVLFAATALTLSRGASLVALGGAAAVAVYLITTTPLKLDLYPYYEAPGLAIAALPNRVWRWPADTVETSLVLVAVLSAVLIAARRPAGLRSRIATTLTAVLAVGAIGWTLTAEVYAARGFETMTQRFLANFPSPPNWLDQTTGGRSVTYLGQQVRDANGVQLTEFWNRSLVKVWSVDGSAPGPGPTLTPDLARPDGSLTPSPDTDFVLADGGVAVRGEPVVPGGTLYRLHGAIRLAHSQTNVYSDGWMGSDAAYNRFDVEPGDTGFAKIELSRKGWCGANVPGHVIVKVGPLVVGEDKQAAIGRVTAMRRATINSCEQLPIIFRAPSGPWRAQVHIEPTFVPQQLDPRVTENRQLGAQVSFDYERLR